eukprot:jgi/Picsp_1/1944/NSC_05410-R1_protein
MMRMDKASDMGVVGLSSRLRNVRPCLPKRVLPCRACDTKNASISYNGDVSNIFFPDQRVVKAHTLPSTTSRIHHVVNLTNGIEALPMLKKLGIRPYFSRLQSTHCEQNHFDLLVDSLDSTLLFSLALGNCCLMYDFGSRNKKRGAPRAIWYGLEFVRYALSKLWRCEEIAPAYLRGHDVSRVFDQHIENLGKSRLKKLKYYRQYVGLGGKESMCKDRAVQLYGVYFPTVHDTDAAYYREIAHKWNNNVHKEDDGKRQQRQHKEEYVEAVEAGIPFGHEHCARAHPLEEVLGMRIFLGGICHSLYGSWHE